MLTDRTQRWRDRRSLFVSGDTMIDPSRYAVDIVDHTTARAFISDHHYLPRYPAAQVAVGLFGPGAAGRPALSGLIVFGVPATGAVITRHERRVRRWTAWDARPRRPPVTHPTDRPPRLLTSRGRASEHAPRPADGKILPVSGKKFPARERPVSRSSPERDETRQGLGEAKRNERRSRLGRETACLA
ncbi:hypothetical protein [Sphingomonas bacterium]|uniref:hypothetical protein n=1 Tax=Sphingomonas bacterium TaxID=1895847 RepID=UPI0020C6C11A|nr:hypothetical protein [Sphingomonas bacterium]